MTRVFTILFPLLITASGYSQALNRPKLVVGIVVDQMRWDFLYRYYDRYHENGGFKRMLNYGFSCENTIIPFTQTVTATGHAGIYTGSVPAITGITGNTWWDNELNKSVYCVEDKSVTTVGTSTEAGLKSPKNMLVNTICDELKLATNFRSKVIGISLKDRSVILATGHSADAAYWYDTGNGNWISSSYYMNELPAWVTHVNDQKMVDKYYKKGWNTLYPITSYEQSTKDENEFEGKPFGSKFPYDLKSFAEKNYNIINTTPYGNTITSEMAKAAVINERLGSDDITDLLAISYSSPDYIGHSFGPNSIEIEDCFLRLDQELGDMLDFLDTKVGKGKYLVFLTADHGVAHIPGFLKENKMPGGKISLSGMVKAMNEKLNEKFGKNTIITGIYNYQVHLNHSLIQSSGIERDSVIKWVMDYLSVQPAVASVIQLDKLPETILHEKIKKMIANSYYPRRSGDIQIILHTQWMESSIPTGTTHGLWNPYDNHIPLLWYGLGVKPGKLYRETYITDIATTLAAILKIQAPNGSVGNVIEEVLK